MAYMTGLMAYLLNFVVVLPLSMIQAEDRTKNVILIAMVISGLCE